MCRPTPKKCLCGESDESRRDSSSEDDSSDSDEDGAAAIPIDYRPSPTRRNDFHENGVDKGPFESTLRPELGPIARPRGPQDYRNQSEAPTPSVQRVTVRGNYCIYCHEKGYNTDIVHSHRMQIFGGPVICPYLRVIVCPKCGASGDNAHTVDYCPRNRFRTLQEIEQEIRHEQYMEKVMGVFYFLGKYSLFPPQQTQPNGPPVPAGNTNEPWFFRKWPNWRDYTINPARI
ncbi:uncharacterized protein LOC129807745 [Phlebotomus papatasi]|uniref:uncharacterized protein LOC129807745 n=1 Tax=Phlebotomus papatasi TaxID=29031 RepID=UPI0024836BF0|nr:uncharacterized protein LOC129807745 [Phlebotomus papatasi]